MKIATFNINNVNNRLANLLAEQGIFVLCGTRNETDPATPRR